MAALIDPLADLKAEIAAEDAAAAAAAAQDPDETAAAEAELAAEEARVQEAEAAAAAAEAAAATPAGTETPPPPKKGKKKPAPPEERMVPVERMNEYAVRVRQLEKQNEELEKKLNPPPPPPPQPQRTEDQIRAEARAHARLEIQLEQFTLEGHAKFTQKAFDAACDKVAKLIGGPSNLVAVAMEATGSPKDASVAIMTLGSFDAPEITAFLALSPIRQAAQLAKWATARTKRAATEDEDPPPRRGRPRVEVEVDEELEPLRPLSGANHVQEGLGDDVPMDVWVERFDKQVLNKPRPH